ncbi:MAG TPA: tetratricopeptide repeat protein [Ktedonobacterales bacterium]|nr:tetratricopeptide repeat protein [Ktedonobacterales bacterium]
MPHEIAVAYLIISRMVEPPPATEVSRSVAAAGLGVLDYEAAGESGALASGGRRRIGTFNGAVPGTAALVRMVVWRAGEPVTTGMGEPALNVLASGLDAEDARTLREGRLSFDLRATVGDGSSALPALTWMVRVARLVADECGGVVMDPLAQRCAGPSELSRLQASDVLAHVTIHNEPWGVESRWLHTHGLQKFCRPELELIEVPLSLVDEATGFLRDVTASLATGARLAAGGEIDLDELGTVFASSAPSDVDHQAAFGRLRLTDAPLPGEREGTSHALFLTRVALAEAARRRDSGDIEGALRDIDRVLAADPDQSAALMLKAQIYLSQGQITDALDLGELMELRVPGDYRGPLCTGMALAALERYREALRELERAIEREPDAAEVFAVRAAVYERLGQEQHAAQDRARVAYLAR